MKFQNVAVASLACVDAPVVVTSADLEARLAPTINRLQLPRNVIEALTGIRARRFWEPGVQPSDVATLAGNRALLGAGVDPARVGVLINTSVCKDFIEPSVAALVHGNLGLSGDCMNFDVGNACLAFLNGMEIAGNMIERGQVDYALVVDGEGSRYVVEQTIQRLLAPDCDNRTFRENLATLTLGSGAAAAVLARGDLAPEGHKLMGGVSLAATQYNKLCFGQREQMTTDAGGLLDAGIDLAARTFLKAIDVLNWTCERFDELVLHQVSAYHTTKLLQTLGLDRARAYAIYEEYGNIGPAAIPIALAKAVEAGRVVKGDRVALMGIGSGLNCSMMELVW